MKTKLHRDGVHIANLSTNLRNTKDIGEVSRSVQTFSGYFANLKMTQHIQPLPVKSNDVKSSKPPLLIPMRLKNRTKHLKQVIKRALERAKVSTQNVVIIYDCCSSSSDEIRSSLVELGEEEILIHPKKSKNESPESLIDYLKQPKGIYVVPFEFFVGMESNSLIYIINLQEDGNDFNASKSIRCNISRAVAQLSIIHEMRDASLFSPRSNKILFQSTEVDPTFVECEKTILYTAFKCNSDHSNSSSTSSSTSAALPFLERQNQGQETLSRFLNIFTKEKYICESCIHICHKNHEQRLFVKLEGGSYPTCLKLVCGLFARMIKISITGETKCCCNEITTCQIVKTSSDSFFNFDCSKFALSRFFNLFLVYTFIVLWKGYIKLHIPGIIVGILWMLNLFYLLIDKPIYQHVSNATFIILCFLLIFVHKSF